MRGQVAVRVYAVLVRLLPAWLRQRAGEEMRITFEARYAERTTVAGRFALLCLETAGVLAVAVRARLQPSRSFASRARQRRAGALDSGIQEVRYAARALRRRPALLALALLTLGLGVGTSTAMFTVVDAVLLKPLPFDEPERIVLVSPTIEEWRGHESLGAQWQRGRFSGVELHAWLNEQRSFEHAAGYTVSRSRVASAEGAQRIDAGLVTADFFAVLRARPLLGRLLDADDAGERVVVLTHAFWQKYHGGDRHIVGQDIVLDDRPAQVVGVLHRDFAVVGIDADVWIPLQVSPTANINNHSLLGIGRLRDGVTIAAASDETAGILQAATAGEAGHLTHHAHITRPVELASGPVRAQLLILMAASLLLLAVACANVALLLLGAGAERVRELAVRGALGADARRLALQLLAESTMLGVLGAAFGLLCAKLGTRALLLIAPTDIPRLDAVTLDLRAFGFAAGLAVLTGLVAGCLPAFSLSRVDAGAALRAGATTPARGRLQRLVVVTELALATMLLVGAGLLTRTMTELQRVDPGFRADGVITVELNMPINRMRENVGSWDDVAAVHDPLVTALRQSLASLPGVDDVALTSSMPFSRDRGTTNVEPEGYEPVEGEVIDAAFRFVTGNYFDVLRIRPVQGRLLTAADDRAGAERVMVVTDRFARRFWPDGRWVDRTVTFWGNTYRVVGIIPDTREQDIRGDADAYKFYVAARDSYWGRAGNIGSNFLVRTDRPAATVMPELRARIRDIDDAIIVARIAPVRERISGSMAEYRYRMRLMVAFSVIAAGFALLGIHGVMSRAVVSRRRELGVRIALGAQRVDITSHVLRDGLRLAALGVAVGLFGAFGGARLLESILWGVPPTDAPTFVVIGAALLALSAATTFLPALRAAAVEPMSVLKG